MIRMPVCTGSVTSVAVEDRRRRRARPARAVRAAIGAPPSSGRPSGSTTRPSSAAPTGDAHDVAGAAHDLARLDRPDLVQQHAADPVALERLGEAELAGVEAQHLVEPRRSAGRRPGRCRRRPARRGRSRRPPAPSAGAARRAACAVEPASALAFDVMAGLRASSVDRGRGRRARNCWRSRHAAPRSSMPAISVGSAAEATSAARRAPRGRAAAVAACSSGDPAARR